MPTNAGGTALYVANNLKAVPRPDIKGDIPLVESCWAEIDADEAQVSQAQNMSIGMVA